MTGAKVNNYSQVDSNILELQLTTDKTFKGYHQLTLTNYDTTTVPAIAAGSAIECNGALYKFDSEEAISTTDPVTSATVADGTVYVCIVPGTTTATAAFTATAPTWSDSKQGWYGTGGQANYRYAEYFMTKATSAYSPKIAMYSNRYNTFFSTSDSVERSTASTSYSDETNMILTFTALPNTWYRLTILGEFKKNGSGSVKIKQYSGNGTCYQEGSDSYTFPSSYLNYSYGSDFFSSAGGSVSFIMEWSSNVSGTLYAQNRILTARLLN